MTTAMTTDRELLGRYAETGSEDAFREIVHRHVSLVYGAALRQLCGDAPLAEDVTQTVFTTLAARAKSRSPITHLAAWLYTTTRFAVSHAVRSERRRRARELEAHKMNEALAESSPEFRPEIPTELIDEALAGLDDRDREAVMLRFFEGQSFAAIGRAMEMGEDAARMRVTRALDKIRATFARKGVTSSVAAVGATLASQAIAAPAGLAANVSTTALAGTAAAVAGVKLGILTYATTKTLLGFAGGAIAIALIGLAYFHQGSAAKPVVGPSIASPPVPTQPHLVDRPAAPLVRMAPPPAARPAVTAQTPEDAVRAQQAADASRMARMKPWLEAGMPIRGSVTLLIDGQSVEKSVEFIMGKDALVDTGNGTLVVTPELLPDGSVHYAVAFRGKDWDGTPDKEQRLPAVVDTPWGSFTVGVGDQVFAFDPDESRLPP